MHKKKNFQENFGSGMEVCEIKTKEKIQKSEYKLLTNNVAVALSWVKERVPTYHFVSQK